MPADSMPAIFLFSFAISFGAVVSPGPVSAAIVTEAPRQGWQVGPLVAGGHTFLELIMVLLLSLGLATFMTIPLVADGVALIGGLVLLFFGASYIYKAWKGDVQLADRSGPEAPRSPGSMFALGMLTTISNPFWYTWWVTVAAGYLAQAQAFSLAAVAAFYWGHISADFVWDTTLSVVASASTRWLSTRAYKALLVLTGAFMLYLSFVFLRSATSN